MNKTYTVLQYGRIYRQNGVAWGNKGSIGGLSHHDVIKQIYAARARDETVDIFDDQSKKRVLINQFVKD